MRVGILQNQNPDSVDRWIRACEKRQLRHKVIDLTSNYWLEAIKDDSFAFFLSRPPGDIERFKIMYDEKLYIIAKVLRLKVYPSYEECLIYENKKMSSYYFAANDIPHPRTWLFYNYDEAAEFLIQTRYPVVAKSSIGAAGSGVKIIREKETAMKYITKAFKDSGIRRRFGPNRVTGSPSKWFFKAMSDPAYFKKKWNSYLDRHKDAQYGYVIFQEYIAHEFEWRVVRIGDSYFAYKKLKVGDKTSGAKSLAFENPPLDMLDFVHEISEKNNITCAAFDLFFSNGRYLINEIQTLFGHIKDHILEVDGKPGRYIHQNGRWIFEQGNFNTNESYDLRLQVALDRFHAE